MGTCPISLTIISPCFAVRLTDGELYAGVYIDFMGTDSAIFRTLGKQTAMRTDQYNSRWLNGKVSTPALFCITSFTQSHCNRKLLIYSSAPEVTVMPHLTFHMLCQPSLLITSSKNCHVGMRLLIFPACSTWPHNHLTAYIKCAMLIVDCVATEPGGEVSRIVAEENYWMSVTTQ